MSAHWYDHAEEFDGDDALFALGFQVIPEHLAKGLTIKLGQIVREVQWEKSPVRVITQDAEYQADRVVITLPLGVLQAGKVSFTPKLTTRESACDCQFGMGVLNKCYLRFQEPFWSKEVDWLEYIPDTYGAWTEWVSYWRVAKQPVLLGFNAADRGRDLEGLSDGEIIASAMKTLKTMYGQRIPEPLGYLVTRWAHDPFAMGSYSYNAVGSTPEMRAVLAQHTKRETLLRGEKRPILPISERRMEPI